MSDLQVSVESRDGLERALSIQVPAARIDNEVAQRLQKFGRTASLKGFRPGKVPAKVLEKRYGEQFRNDVLQEVLQSSYQEAIVQEKLRPVGMPRFEPEQLDSGQDLKFTAVFEIYPEIELTDLAKLKVERPVVEVGDADIDEMIDSLRRQRVEWEAVDRKSKDGDRVRVNFSATLKGEPLEGGSGDDVPVILGEGSMLPDFEKALKGVKADEEKDFTVKFPKDYHEPSLGGEKAEFTAKVIEVAASKLPEIDEEFIKSFGVESGQMDDLRADVRRNMEREAEARSAAELKKQVMDAILEANEVNVPAALVQEESASLQQDAMRQMGIQDPAQAPALESFRETAEQRTRLGLLVGAVINEHKVQVDNDRVKAKVEEICAPYEEPEEIAKMYFQNPDLLRSVENVVLEEQVVDLIVGQAAVKDKNIAFSDLVKA